MGIVPGLAADSFPHRIEPNVPSYGIRGLLRAQNVVIEPFLPETRAGFPLVQETGFLLEESCETMKVGTCIEPLNQNMHVVRHHTIGMYAETGGGGNFAQVPNQPQGSRGIVERLAAIFTTEREKEKTATHIAISWKANILAFEGHRVLRESGAAEIIIQEVDDRLKAVATNARPQKSSDAALPDRNRRDAQDAKVRRDTA